MRACVKEREIERPYAHIHILSLTLTHSLAFYLSFSFSLFILSISLSLFLDSFSLSLSFSFPFKSSLYLPFSFPCDSLSLSQSFSHFRVLFLVSIWFFKLFKTICQKLFYLLSIAILVVSGKLFVPFGRRRRNVSIKNVFLRVFAESQLNGRGKVHLPLGRRSDRGSFHQIPCHHTVRSVLC